MAKRFEKIVWVLGVALGLMVSAPVGMGPVSTGQSAFPDCGFHL